MKCEYEQFNFVCPRKEPADIISTLREEEERLNKQALELLKRAKKEKPNSKEALNLEYSATLDRLEKIAEDLASNEAKKNFVNPCPICKIV